MINTKVLFSYLSKIYRNYFLLVSFLLTSILIISNIFDNLQRFKDVNVPTHIFWSMVFYKVPYLLTEISPLISFIAMLFFLRVLTKHNELVTIFCNGSSLWRVLSAPLMVGLLFGFIITYLIGPIGAYGLDKYEMLEAKILKKKQNEILISSTGILFFEENKNSNHIVQAKTINFKNSELKDLMLLFINKDNKFLRRIDAKTAILKNKKFELMEAMEYTDEISQKHDLILIDTDLEIKDFLDNFISPEKINIWRLNYVIEKMLKSGMPIINYQIYYFKQLFKPLMIIATIMLGSCFFSLKTRDNSQNKIFVGGLIIGFIIYSTIEIFSKMLAFGGFMPMLSILLPILLLIFVSSFLIAILH